MKRIGLFGGTFDPPHNGHLTIANEAVCSLQLDELWFIPTYEPPLKEAAATPSEHRLRMLELMIAAEAERTFRVNTIELERKGTSYTIDTIKYFLKKHPQVKFYFIIGADQVVNLHRWYQIDELIELIQFVGVERPGITWEEQRYPVHRLAISKVDVSSTKIRRHLQEGRSVRHLVPESVYHYIKEQRLYGS